MSRISIDVTDKEHQQLKALAALRGKSIKEFVLERTLGVVRDQDDRTLVELERLLDERIREANAGSVSHRTVGEIFEKIYRSSGSTGDA